MKEFLLLHKNRLGWWALHLVLGGMIWFLFRTVLLHPTQSLIWLGGDGTKNYYAYIYQCLYGHGSQFYGMFYPYGEHMFYTDNQPLLVWIFYALKHYFSWGEPEAYMLMNITFPLMMWISGMYSYGLLRKLQISVVLSILGSCLMVFLPPNFFKIFGHYGMSYSLWYTGSLYYVVSYFMQHKQRYLWKLSVLLIISGFFHAYNIAITSLMIAGFSLIYYLQQHKPWREKAKPLLTLWMYVFGVLLIWLLFIRLSDPVHDRPNTPYGILQFCTHLPDVFTSIYSDFGVIFSELFHTHQGADILESYAYIGFFNILFVVYLLLYGVMYSCRKKLPFTLYTLQPLQWALVGGGLICLLFAMGIPFIWGLQSVYIQLPILKQFRALGRFSWGLFFTLTPAMLISVQAFIHELKNSKQWQGLITLCSLGILLLTLEIFSYTTVLQQNVDQAYKNHQAFKSNHSAIVEFNTQHHIADNYQCLMALPFFLNGSDKIVQPNYGHISDFAYQYTLTTGLPLVNAYLGRSSWSRTFQLIKLVGGAWTNKSDIEKLFTAKPILIAAYNGSSFTAGERHLIQHAQPIGQLAQWQFYSLSLRNLVLHEQEAADIILKHPVSDEKNAITNHFETTQSHIYFTGQGAKKISDSSIVVLYEGAIPFAMQDTIQASVWARVDTTLFYMPTLTLTYFNQFHQPIRKDYSIGAHSTDNHPFWFRIDHEFIMADSLRFVRIELENHDKKAASHIDDFCIQSSHDTIIYKQKNYILINNHRFNLKP